MKWAGKMEDLKMKKNTLLSAAIGIVLFACTTPENEVLVNDVEPEVEISPVEPSVEIMPDNFIAKSDTVTKAGFDYDSVNKKYVHHWTDGDQVYVFHGTTRATYSCTNAATGVFTKVVDSETPVSYTFTNYCAVFDNLSSDYYAPNANNRIRPAVGSYYTSSGDGYGNVMVACSDDGETFVFTSIVGWLKLQLKGTKSVSSIDVWGKNDEYTYGLCDVSFNVDLSFGTSWSFDGACNTVEFTSPAALNESTATAFYVAIPPVSFDDGIDVVVHYSDGTQSNFGTANTVVINANKVTPMATLNVVKNLGSSETANCYIVTPGNLYKFPTVQGNSSTSVGTVDHVSVLWETKNDFSSAPSTGQIINNVTYADGYIHFFVPKYNLGNALIAAYDDSDEILWSWHIWKVNSSDVPGSVTYTNKAAGTFLDRNLGALSKDKTQGSLTWGLYYQWGRKDPFLGGTNGANPSEKGYAATSYSPSAKVDATNPTYKTMEYRTKNPTVFVYDNGSSTMADKQECNWDFTESAGTLTPSKTIYDPCPPGYAVSTGAKNSGVNVLDTYRELYCYWWIDGGASNYDSTYKGYSIDGNWYPFESGLVLPVGTSYHGDKTPYAAYHTVAYSSAIWFKFTSSQYYPWTDSNMHMRSATPIRCQKVL